MALLRIEKVVLALTPSERELVDDDVRTQSRKELITLWDIVCTAVSSGIHLEEQKEDVFSKCYSRPYTDKEDYLLRNEYRLLLNRIYDLLTAQSYTEELKRNQGKREIALLRTLLAKKLWQEFDAVAEKACTHAIDIYDYTTALDIIEMQFLSVNYRGSISHERMLDTIALIQKRADVLRLFYVSEAERMQSYCVAAEHTVEASGYDYKRTPRILDADIHAQTNALIEYFRHKAIAVQYRGEGRLEAAQKAVEYVLQIPDDNITLRREKIIAFSTYGTLLMNVASDHKAAAEANLAAIEFMKKFNLPAIDMLVLFNYCSSLMKLRDYPTALHVIEEHYERVVNDARVGFRFMVLKAFAHIFLDDWKSASKTLPQQINRAPENEYHYAWFILSIIAHMRGDTEDALREIVNFAKRFSRRNLEILQPHEHEIVNAYRAFYQGILANEPKKRAKFFNSTIKHIQTSLTSGLHKADYMPILWLHDQVKKEGIVIP
ncbi:MAG: hypothetical protein JNJ85_10075 [Candidatus Kapabacteria bacterium]|nr:hypothetical protein [Candidatus Kapabacteria bacterium]